MGLGLRNKSQTYPIASGELGFFVKTGTRSLRTKGIDVKVICWNTLHYAEKKLG